MLRHLWSGIITSHICLLCLAFAYSIFLLLKTGSLLPLRISNWETQTWIQRKSSRQQKLTRLWDAGIFSLRFSRVRLEISLEWGSHYPALQRLRWAPVVNKRAHGFVLVVLGKAAELCHLQGRKIKGSMWKHCGPYCLEQTLRRKRNFLI